jgi:hypothetical protein
MAGTTLPAPASAPAQPQSQSYFEIVSSNLLKLGALTLEDFLRDPYQKPAPRESFLSNPLYHDAPLVPPLVLDDQNGENGKPAPTPAPIFVLHQICSQTFGSIDALDYEIIEEEGKESEWIRVPFNPPPIAAAALPRCAPAHHHFFPFGLEFFAQRNSASSPSHGLTVHRAHTRRNRNSRARQKHAPLLQPSRSTWAR